MTNTTLSDAILLQIEALIFASPVPISSQTLRQSLKTNPDLDQYVLIDTDYIHACIMQINHAYADRAVHIITLATGFQFQVKKQFSTVIQETWTDRPIKLSQALLETLAVIAYQQPVTRADIEAVRGVTLNSSILKNLFERGWIKEEGCRPVAGRPALLVTTPEFLNAFNLKNTNDLPTIIMQNGQTLALVETQAVSDTRSDSPLQSDLS